MFTGLKHQLELTDTLIDDILPQDNELIKLKKVLNWKAINKIYKECFVSRRGRGFKKTDSTLGLIILKHLYKKSDSDLVKDLHLNTSYMHFCSLSYDEVSAVNRTGKQVINSSTLSKKIARFHLCGGSPLSLGKSLNDIAFVQKSAIEGNVLGVSLNVTVKPGKVTFGRISKAGDEYVMLITRGEMFEDKVENRKNTGWPTWPYTSAKLEGDVEKFMNNLRSQYMHFCYSDLVNELVDTCELLGIRPIVCV